MARPHLFTTHPQRGRWYRAFEMNQRKGYPEKVETQNFSFTIDKQTPGDAPQRSRTLLIVLLIVLVLAASVVAYLLFFQNPKASSVASTNTNTENDSNVAVTENQNSNANSAVSPDANTNQPLPKLSALSEWNKDYRPIFVKLTEGAIEQVATQCNNSGLNRTDNYCLSEVAVGFRSVATCARISLESAVNSFAISTGSEDTIRCYGSLIKEYGLYDCIIITDQQYRDRCYVAQASALTPTGLVFADHCSDIQDAALKSVCAENVAGSKEHQAALTNINATLGEFQQAVDELTAAFCYVKNNPSTSTAIPEGTVRDGFVELTKDSTLVCDKYTTDQYDNIAKKFATDVDGDGVNAFVEKYFTIDDAKADTDGDGYDDLTELKSGYNPAGSGKLDAL